ncbi:hypothetical protein Nepgr_021478 [Nepenthes gracilis]|uniref:DYW domain-containing protein n=1 Tax=Nepenthes gracilis TaxID=150966 RepID=A0AAD3T035_NEPGR|nr:hypothetical protein Nepgr_021478 [Nepenthes gracilis]
MIWGIIPRLSESHILREVCSKVVSICNAKSIKEGISVHSPIIKLGIQHDLFLNNNLLSIYGKCYGAEPARNVFDEMPSKDVVSWTCLLSTYVKNENPEEALELFKSMLISGLYPNEFTLSSVFRSCSDLGELDVGRSLHCYTIKSGFDPNPVLGSALVDLYSKCDNIFEAYKLFERMSNGDTISWTTMISSFTQAGKWSEALKLYVQMLETGVSPNEFTFAKLLTAASCVDLNYGKLVHAHLIVWGADLNLVLKTALVDMYAKCQRIVDALKVSNQTPESDVTLWTTIISVFAQNSQFNEAVAAFREMELSGFMPNNFTYSSILNASSSTLKLEFGKQIHSRVIMAGLNDDVSVGNALTNMYMKCSETVEDALLVFRGIASPNVISWTSLIAGLAEHGYGQKSFQAFAAMQFMGVKPNSVTLSSILVACATSKSLSQLTQIHGYIVKTKADNEIAVCNALVDAYAGLEEIEDAWRVVGIMSHRNVITYTSLATRINQMGQHEMALTVISKMCNDGVKMDGYSLAGFLSAAASLVTMETGKQLHSYSVKSGLGLWLSVSNGLVDLYGKCGSLNDLQKAFEEIKDPDVISCNGVIYGLAANGQVSSALSTFDDMRLAGVEPDAVTFLLLLYACSHGGLVDLGYEYFKSMRNSHNLVPLEDHYVCLVDLLGRSGRLAEAMDVINTMPFKANALIYKTLLSACKLHGDILLGEAMAQKGLELDPSDPALYVLLANLYVDCGRPDLCEKMRILMRDRSLRQTPGQSWMEIRNKVHLFNAGDRSHPQITEIHERITSLIIEFKKRGYLYQCNESTRYHSEKLALAFGLLNAPPKAPIRVIKNLRICRDCHEFFTTASQLVDRDIIVRDGNRFHSFKMGKCSCGGYW